MASTVLDFPYFRKSDWVLAATVLSLPRACCLLSSVPWLQLWRVLDLIYRPARESLLELEKYL